jgi:hypothetical protein
MAPNDKKDQKPTEVPSHAGGASAVSGPPDFGPAISRLEGQLVLVVDSTGALQRALSEQGAELKELRADLKGLSDENESLHRSIDELEQALARGPSSPFIGAVGATSGTRRDPNEVPPGFFRNARGLLVAEEYRGAKQYEMGETAFVAGVLRQPGDRITLVDEQPGKSYRPLVKKVEENLVAGPALATVRAADRTV